VAQFSLACPGPRKKEEYFDLIQFVVAPRWLHDTFSPKSSYDISSVRLNRLNRRHICCDENDDSVRRCLSWRTNDVIEERGQYRSTYYLLYVKCTTGGKTRTRTSHQRNNSVASGLRA
jgi:hypothetical protein